MPRLVDLAAKPYYLSAEQIQWVEDSLAAMTPEEKVGQLFTNLFFFGKDLFSGNDLRCWLRRLNRPRPVRRENRRDKWEN